MLFFGVCLGNCRFRQSWYPHVAMEPRTPRSGSNRGQENTLVGVGSKESPNIYVKSFWGGSTKKGDENQMMIRTKLRFEKGHQMMRTKLKVATWTRRWTPGSGLRVQSIHSPPKKNESGGCSSGLNFHRLVLLKSELVKLPLVGPS